MEKPEVSVTSVKSAEHRKPSFIAYKTEEEVRRALAEVFVFICFLTVTTLVALSCHNTYEFYFNHTIERLFLKRNSRNTQNKLSFEDIAIISDWWNFVKYTFLEDIFLNLAAGNLSALTNRHRFLDENVLLELPRLRQIRIKPHECYDHALFQTYFNQCYTAYDGSYEENAPFYKGTPFHSLENNHILPIWAKIERYRGAGYVKFLTYNFLENHDIIDELINSSWIDRATRLVIVEFVIYNNNMDLFSNIKFMAEILPTGGVVPHWYMEVVPLFSPWSTTNPPLLATVIIFYLLVIYNTINEFWEMYSFGIKSYMESLWNYFDWLIITTATVACVLSLLHEPLVDHYLNVSLGQFDELSSLDRVCFLYLNYKAAIAICTILSWIRIFRFISFNDTMLYFTLSLKQCAREIFGFAIILFIFFMAFALLGLMLFGFTNPDFSSFKNSYFFMVRLLLRDFDYPNFEKSNPFWGALYFMLYILFVVFILVNMFLAIISQTYIQVKQKKQESNSALKEVFTKFFRKILHCCRSFKAKLAVKSQLFLRSSQSRMSTGTQHSLYRDSVIPKKLTFDTITPDEGAEVPTSTSNLKSDRSAKRLSKDEALKVYFGRESSDSNTSPISDISLSSYHTIESLSDELLAQLAALGSYDNISGISDRIASLEEAFENLKADLERLSSIFGR